MIRLAFATIEWTDAGCRSEFYDGSGVDSVPHPNDHHYYVVSHRTGYRDDIMTYCREHDFCHHFVMERLSGTVSPSLWAVAHGTEIEHAAIEELAVMAFQRWIRMGEEPIVSGVNWDQLKVEALRLLERA